MLKNQVAQFFEDTPRTVDHDLAQNAEELLPNSDKPIKYKYLKINKLVIYDLDIPETDFGNISIVPQLRDFNFRALLNLAIPMRKSERAGLLGKANPDTLMDTINPRTG